MLVDDDDALFVLRHEVTVVDLQHALGGDRGSEARRERGRIGVAAAFRHGGEHAGRRIEPVRARLYRASDAFILKAAARLRGDTA